MKNLLIIIIFYIFSLISQENVLFSHTQRTHQYIVREAYKLLQYYLGSNNYIPLFNQYFGTIEDGGWVGNWPLHSGNPWCDQRVVAGAYREDEEDVIYHYGNSLSDWSRYLWASITHFWEADRGDDALTNLDWGGTDIPNSYQKFLRFANNGDGIYIQKLCRLPGKAFQMVNLHIHYNSIIDMFKNKNLYIIRAEFFGQGNQYYSPPLKLENQFFGTGNEHLNILIKEIAFEILGRMAHLLTDMSVPVHVHNKSHNAGFWPIPDNSDRFEQDLGVDNLNEWANNEFLNYWNAERVWNTFGSIMNPYVTYDNPLHHLCTL